MKLWKLWKISYRSSSHINFSIILANSWEMDYFLFLFTYAWNKPAHPTKTKGLCKHLLFNEFTFYMMLAGTSTLELDLCSSWIWKHSRSQATRSQLRMLSARRLWGESAAVRSSRNIFVEISVQFSVTARRVDMCKLFAARAKLCWIPWEKSENNLAKCLGEKLAEKENIKLENWISHAKIPFPLNQLLRSSKIDSITLFSTRVINCVVLCAWALQSMNKTNHAFIHWQVFGSSHSLATEYISETGNIRKKMELN